MAINVTAIRAKVESGIAKVGRSTVFVVKDETYDRSGGSYTENSPAQSAPIVTSPPLSFGTELADGDIVQEGDAMLVVAAKAVDDSSIPFGIENTGEVLIDGVSWTVVGFKTHELQDQKLAYELHIRR